jgi:hypothetical protein
MASAPDIITYIGVPLAVLGVLPIIYNTISTLATLAKVRRMLRRSRLVGITRGDVVNRVIEVELPRYTLAPLHREREYKDYWRLSDYPSRIPGGSWTIFNWKSNAIGLKTQRLDYSDQLRQPQAEIGFEELLSFLLDLGAVPDPVGFRMLRTSGLWIPAGTPLLLSPDRTEKVLTIAPLDDSDGHLSLAVYWSSKWDMRDQNSLPPYWVLIKGTPPTRPVTKVDGTAEQPSDGIDGSTVSVEVKGSTALQYMPLAPPAIRCQVGINGVISAVPDDFDAQMFESLDVRHLEVDESGLNTAGIWFASALTALSTSSQTILWNYKIPSDILAFSKKDTIPCGILVLLDLVEESATPEWATKYDDEEEEREAKFRKMNEQARAVLRESQLPPDQRAAAFRERAQRQHEDWVAGLNAARRRDEQRAETRMMEALQSPKWGNKLIAGKVLPWLQKEGHVDASHDSKRAVEVLLWKLINDPPMTRDLARMLDQWKAFVDNGGLRKADYLTLKENRVMFGYASLLLAVIEDSVMAALGSLAMDLQECIRIWKRVRLG